MFYWLVKPFRVLPAIYDTNNKFVTEPAYKYGENLGVEEMNTGSIAARVKAIIDMTKPLQTFLLMVTMIGGYLAAGASNLRVLSLLLLVGYSSIGGTTVLNMYLERDIDAVMERTRGRPLPSNKVSEWETIFSAAALLVIGVYSASLINEYVVFTVLAGLYFDIIIYTNLVKRRTPFNIILGGIAGSMPALGGWAAARGSIELGGIILSASVMLWIPLHIWILAYYLKDDYLRASIPMFPVLASPVKTATYIKASLYMLMLSVASFMFTQGYGVIAFIVTSTLILRALSILNKFASNPDKNMAFKLYKFASPIIGVLFILLPLDHVFKGYECIILKILVGG